MTRLRFIRFEAFMRRYLVLAAFTFAAACGSSPTTNNAPPSPYHVRVEGTPSHGANQAGDEVFSIQVKVTDKATGDSVPNQKIILQLSAGDANPISPTSNAQGRAGITWTVPAADKTPGTTQAIAFCAPAPGTAFCKTSLSGTDAFQYTF
jgi:hypothetical protein